MKSPNAEGARWILETFGDVLACPCGGSFELHPSTDALVCVGCKTELGCGDRILRNNCPTESESAAIQHQINEQRVRDEQASVYDAVVRMNGSNWIEERRFKKLITAELIGAAIDLGCGTGRMTVHLAAHAQRTVAVDRSLMSLYQCRTKLKARNLEDKVLLVQSDLGALPLQRQAFDFALSAQVVQHLPEDQLQEQAIAEIAAILKPQSRFLLSLYKWSGRGLMNRKKNGFHPGGISFHRYTADEIHRLLGPHFVIRWMRPSLRHLWITYAQLNRSQV